MNLKEKAFFLMLSLLTLTLPVGCNDGAIDFRIVSDEVEEIAPDAVIQILIYGFDERMSEDSAVIVSSTSSKTSLATELPATESFGVADLTEDVCKDDSDCRAKFYWVVQIDMDGDALICDGDLVQDETLTPHQTYTMEELIATDHEVYVGIKDDGTCRDMEPTGWDPLYSLSLRIDSQEEVALNPNSVPYVIFSGTDQSAADPAPNPLLFLQGVFDLPATLPHEVVVEITDEPAQWICEEYDADNPCPIDYFYTVYVDVDGDGQICDGDLVQDFDLTPFQSYSMDELAEDTKAYFLKVKNDGATECIDPFEDLDMGF